MPGIEVNSATGRPASDSQRPVAAAHDLVPNRQRRVSDGAAANQDWRQLSRAISCAGTRTCRSRSRGRSDNGGNLSNS